VIAIGSRTATLVDGVALPGFAVPPLVRFPAIDDGAYSWGDVADLAVLAPLVAHVDRDDPRRRVVRARVVALEPGDYILAHHDPLADASDADDDLPLELVLDLSPAASPGAELYYRRRGAAFFAVPATPGTLAIVERGPAITANHSYLSKRHRGARVVRLIARLTSAR
jgi:hypothetical protein